MKIEDPTSPFDNKRFLKFWLDSQVGVFFMSLPHCCGVECPEMSQSFVCLLTQGALTVEEVKFVENIVVKMAEKNEEVYAKETALSDAKAVQGLRAVFDEVCRNTLCCFEKNTFV